MVGDFYIIVGWYDVNGAWPELFVLLHGDDGYWGAPGEYLSQVAGTRGVEVLCDHGGQETTLGG